MSGRANSLANLRPFQPGNNANPGGRPKEVLRPLLVLELARSLKKGKVERSKGEWLAENLVKMALSNRNVAVAAAKIILDHVDPRLPSDINLHDDGEQALRVSEIRAALGIGEAAS